MRGDDCNWPHVIMSPDEERAVAEMIASFEPFILEQAMEFAGRRKQLALDLAQEARILLWRWGVEKVSGVPLHWVHAALIWRMQDIRRFELLHAPTEPVPEDQSQVA